MKPIKFNPNDPTIWKKEESEEQVDEFVGGKSERQIVQSQKLIGRIRPDQSEFMKKANPMAGKVHPNKGKAMPQISEKITGIKRSEETKKQIGATRKAKGLTNTWSGVERPEQSKIMKDPARNKGAQTMRETMTCPHCGKTANVPNYKRWHGDNCKAKK